MKMCSECWSKLRAAIDARGLTEFVAKNGEEAASRLMSNDAKAGFDPLMGAHNALVSNIAHSIGLAAFSEGCPLCLIINNCTCGEGEKCVYRTWIDRAADDQLDHARRFGLVPAA